MSKEKIKEQTKQIMATVFKIDVAEIPDDISTETHEVWESVRHINLILALEEKFGIRFGGEELMEVLSLQEIVNSIEKKSAAA